MKTISIFLKQLSLQKFKKQKQTFSAKKCKSKNKHFQSKICGHDERQKKMFQEKLFLQFNVKQIYRSHKHSFVGKNNFFPAKKEDRTRTRTGDNPINEI